MAVPEWLMIAVKWYLVGPLDIPNVNRSCQREDFEIFKCLPVWCSGSKNWSSFKILGKNSFLLIFLFQNFPYSILLIWNISIGGVLIILYDFLIVMLRFCRISQDSPAHLIFNIFDTILQSGFHRLLEITMIDIQDNVVEFLDLLVEDLFGVCVPNDDSKLALEAIHDGWVVFGVLWVNCPLVGRVQSQLRWARMRKWRIRQHLVVCLVRTFFFRSAKSFETKVF